MPHVIKPRHPISTRTSRTICPAKEYVEPMSTTVSPVTHTAEMAVKSDGRVPPHSPSALAQGAARRTAPIAMSTRKPSAIEVCLFKLSPS